MLHRNSITGLLILTVVFAGMGACAPRNTPPAVAPTPTVVSGWERVIHAGQCGYVVDFPAEMDVAEQGAYNRIISPASTEPVPNFIYISVIPDDLQTGEPGTIYNYDPVETRTLLGMQVGESRPLREDATTAPWFTYTRQTDRALGGQPAQTYENEQPWEFPLGTKEIRYYLQAQGCTYLVGGYMATVGSGQPGWFDEARFDEIMGTFRLAP